MSSSINLDLDFQEYTPSNQSNEVEQKIISSPRSGTITRSTQDNSKRSSTRPNSNTSEYPQSSTGSSILNILQGVSTKSGISDEALRQLSWVSGGAAQQQQQSAKSVGCGLGFLAKYFDVTTDDVLERILWSAVPIKKKGIQLDIVNDQDLIAPLAAPEGLPSLDSTGDRFITAQQSHTYMERFIQSRPDLYGPFWISTTLVFAVAIFSNIVSFLNFKSQAEQLSMNDQKEQASSNISAEVISGQAIANLDDWHFSVEELSTMSSVVMMYVTLLPTLITFLFWFRGCSKYYTLTETICAYGYSLSIYIPLALLFMIQFLPFRYLTLALASVASGSVLMFSFWPVAKSDPNPGSSYIFLAIIFACHLGLAYIIHRVMLQ